MNKPAFVTADLCDLYENDAEQNLRVVAPIFRSFGGKIAFSGVVKTLSVKDDNALVRAVLSEKSEGGVLVIDGEASRVTALVGGNLGALAQKNGWSGIVVNGAVRDTSELGALDLGVLALAACPKRGEKKGVGTVGEAAHFGGVTFVCGDFLVADADGVIVLSRPLDLNLKS